MRVADECTVRSGLSWCRVVVGRGVDKVAGFEVLDRHLDGERSVGLDCLSVLREDKLGRGHLVHSQNSSHWHAVAGPGLDLLSVRKGHVLCQAKVDTTDGLVNQVG